ncbi:MAG: hypothetical protein JNK41_07715 [Saprospiraceae bacterium]|nr:hypothetical protein [Saprospiraceae bacterium]
MKKKFTILINREFPDFDSAFIYVIELLNGSKTKEFKVKVISKTAHAGKFKIEFDSYLKRQSLVCTLTSNANVFTLVFEPGPIFKFLYIAANVIYLSILGAHFLRIFEITNVFLLVVPLILLNPVLYLHLRFISAEVVDVIHRQNQMAKE